MATAESYEIKKVEVLSDLDRSKLYHISQGAEILPYAIVKAIRIDFKGKTVDPFDPNLLRQFGLIPDKKNLKNNPEGLPVGFTLAVAPETGLLSFGLTCAACHVGQIRYNNTSGGLTSLNLDGGNSQAKIQSYLGVLVKGLANNTRAMSYPFFLKRVNDSVNYINTELKQYTLQSRSQVDMRKINIKWGDQWEAIRKFNQLAQIASEPRETNPKKFAAAEAKNHAQVVSLIQSLVIPTAQKKLLYARYFFLRAAQVSAPYSELYGPGRTDPWGGIKITVLNESGFFQKPNAPVKIPRMFHIEQYEWFHFMSNTNGILERNAGNGIGLGSVVDNRTFIEKDGRSSGPSYASTMRFDSLAEIERLFWNVAPPSWPKDAPARDLDLVERGEQIYRKNCQTCHEPVRNKKGLLNPPRFLTISEVGTDPQYTNNFKFPIKNSAGKEIDLAEEFIAPLMRKIKLRYYDDVGVRDNLKTQLLWEDRYDSELNPRGRRSDEVWRNTLVRENGQHVQPRPLDGAWATGPYLHNGSVPTLYDLLQPVSKRPAAFYTGHNLYDMKKLGYKVLTVPDKKFPEADFLFNTRATGNSNSGHEYGVDLSESEKWALIEFLKGFGGAQSAPVVLDN